MDQITLKSEPKAPRRATRKMRIALVLLLAVAGALVAERWRGQQALRAWQRERISQGEVFDPTLIWPKPNPEHRQFSTHLTHATRQLPDGLKAYAGVMNALVLVEPGQARRGSQEPQPPLNGTRNHPNTWEHLGAAVERGAPDLENLRRLMKLAPPSMGDDVRERLKSGAWPSYVGTRVGAQNLHAATIYELHGGNLAGALEDLAALSDFARLYADEPTLVNFMIRVAVIGLSEDLYWDALQAPGWTDGQLARLQQASQVHPRLDELPRVKQAERADRLFVVESFRGQSFEAWLAHCEPVYRSFGCKLPAWWTAPPVRLWQQWVFHPLWAFAWADQEQLHYLQHTQLELDGLRQAAASGSWRQLDDCLERSTKGYRPPPLRWRFYGALPFYDHLSAPVGSSSPSAASCPYPDYHRAWQTTFRNLAFREMITTAIALKRHQLRYGRWPAHLESLVPEFLPALPRDLMDGQPLRYRLEPESSFTLYSVGENGKDDGGDPRPDKGEAQARNSLSDGRDWVWPRALPPSATPDA